MAKVQIFGKGWFAPTEVDYMDREHKRRLRSGTYYPAGVYDNFPEELVKYLPTSAIVLDTDFVPQKPDVVEDVIDVFGIQAAADQEASILKEAGVIEEAPVKRGRGRPRKNPETK